MAYKYGELVERLLTGQIFFVPDGSNIGTVEVPDLTSRTNKPDAADYPDYDLGRVNTAKYDPTVAQRVREWGKPTGGYKKRKQPIIEEDAFDFTLIDYAATLFDQLMFGLAAAPADNVSQQAFTEATRTKEGWVYIIRTNEDGSVLCLVELHVELSIKAVPDDKNEPGSPVIRVAVLADGGALDTVIFNPA